jgi:two-component system, NtrC family, sensor kinase
MNVTPRRLIDASSALTRGAGERGAGRLGAVCALWTRTRGFRWLWASSILVPLLAFTGAAGFSWRQVQTEARARLTRTIDMLHEHALRSFEMQEAILAAADGRVAGMSWEEIAASREVHVFLRNLDASVPSSNAVGLVGPDGRIASFSRLAFPTPPINLADREYLRPARAGMAGTFISEVIEARPTGTRVFVLSRARSGSDGKPHGGVVTSALSPSYFADFYASITEGPHDAVALAREDGAILARYPPMPEQAPWQAHPDNPLISAAREASGGRGFLQTSMGFDRGEARLVTFRRLEKYPVLVAYGLSTSVLRAAWLRQLLPPGLGAAAAAALLLWLTGRAQVTAQREHLEIERRAEAERARAEAEAALRHAERVNALGHMAAGVAHDFNNTVQAVSSGVRLIKEHAGDSGRVQRYAELIDAAAGRAATLTRRMLDFARRDADLDRASGQAGTVDVAATVNEACELLERTLGSGYHVHREMPLDLPRAPSIGRAELEAVIVNLVVNARDAMPSGGTVNIAAASEDVSAEDAKPQAGLLPGRYIRISIADTGHGMDSATLARASEAFFTTKGLKGTGLGLSMARGFAEHAGGRLAIRSEVGVGTTVTLWLPAEVEEVAQR